MPAAPASTGGCKTLGPKAKAALAAVVDAGAPGAIGLVRSDGQDFCAAGGVSDLENESPMRPGDRWQIASVSKVFTATVVLQLVGEGELSLGDSVEDWLPGLVPRGDEITVLDLLRHSSGIAEYADTAAYADMLRGNIELTATPRRLVAVSNTEPLAFAPGKGYLYSDTNTILAGLIVQEVTGDSLRRALVTRIFTPLKLRDTSFGPYEPTTRATVHGYEDDKNGYVPASYPKPADVSVLGPTVVRGWADAAIVSSAPDLATFFSALLGGDLLDKPQLDTMLTPNPYATEDEGLTGLFVIDTPCDMAYGHEGHSPGFQTQVAASRDGSTVAVSFANLTDGTDAVYDRLTGLEAQLFCEG